jgi:hypothetical protein
VTISSGSTSAGRSGGLSLLSGESIAGMAGAVTVGGGASGSGRRTGSTPISAPCAGGCGTTRW